MIWGVVVGWWVGVVGGGVGHIALLYYLVSFPHSLSCIFLIVMYCDPRCDPRCDPPCL